MTAVTSPERRAIALAISCLRAFVLSGGRVSWTPSGTLGIPDRARGWSKGTIAQRQERERALTAFFQACNHADASKVIARAVRFAGSLKASGYKILEVKS